MAYFKLGAFAQFLSGKAGNTVFVNTDGGTVVRDKVIPTNRNTGAQQASRGNLGKAVKAWSVLPADAVERWQLYATKQAYRDQNTGVKRIPRANNLFAALCTKLLMLNPAAPPPLFPPTEVFLGDVIHVSAEANVGEITFHASGPNAEGATTELLLQNIAGPNRRTYPDKYRFQGFFQFTDASLSHSVPVPTGHWACAVRFVNTATGQTSRIIEIGKVSVLASAMAA